MSTLILTTNTTCAVTLNGGFMGILYSDKEMTVPLSASDTVFCAAPFEQALLPINCLITHKPQPYLTPCAASLYRWNEGIYQLYFDFKKQPCSPPPVIIKEQAWARGYIGLCGSYLVFEGADGSRRHFKHPIDDFTVFSDTCVLAQIKNTLVPLNTKLEPVTEIIPCNDFNIQDGNLKIAFTPGDMDFFTVEQIYNKSLDLVSSKIQEENCTCAFDTLRLFCQAVRLNIKETALKFLTPSLKAEMDFESIKEFLGIFDQTDKPKYLSKLNESTVALRYKIDESNFHYMCYEFTLDTTTDTVLIDDIGEV